MSNLRTDKPEFLTRTYEVTLTRDELRKTI